MPQRDVREKDGEERKIEIKIKKKDWDWHRDRAEDKIEIDIKKDIERDRLICYGLTCC